MSFLEIQHPAYGHGRILKQRNGGFEMLVQFETAIRWVRRSEAVFLNPPPGSLPVQRPVTPRTRDEAFKARQIVEALRFGIAPMDAVERITFGRDREIAGFRRWLDEEDGVLLLEGEYGVGKTHLLEHLSMLALRENFAVSRVSVDAAETTFDKPKQVYRSIIENLRYLSATPERDLLGFRAFLTTALEANRNDAWLAKHEYFDALRQNLDDEDVWVWIEGKGDIRPRTQNVDFYQGYFYDEDGSWVKYPPMYQVPLSANLYTWLLSSLGWLAREVLGLKGLLVFFDEAEAFPAASTMVREARAVNYVSALLRVAQNDPALLGRPRNSRLEYHAYTEHIPFSFARPSGLRLVFAFADLDVLSSRVPMTEHLPAIVIEALEARALKIAIHDMCEMYRTAYGIDRRIEHDLIRRALNKVEDGSNTRRFVKACMEACDLWRSDPRLLVAELELVHD